MKTAHLLIRVNDTFELFPYWHFRTHNFFSKWSVTAWGGWLWIRFNLDIFTKQKKVFKMTNHKNTKNERIEG